MVFFILSLFFSILFFIVVFDVRRGRVGVRSVGSIRIFRLFIIGVIGVRGLDFFWVLEGLG